jgi:hypothetical protein
MPRDTTLDGNPEARTAAVTESEDLANAQSDIQRITPSMNPYGFDRAYLLQSAPISCSVVTVMVVRLSLSAAADPVT